MTLDSRRAIEHDVEKVALRFFHYLDGGDYQKLAALFAADGVWHRQGTALRGPGAVLEAMHARPAGIVTQHYAEHAEATLYLAVFAHSGGADAKPPAPMELPIQVAIYREKLVRSDDGWRIAEITSQQKFKR
jgi:SnoaL-like protein